MRSTLSTKPCCQLRRLGCLTSCGKDRREVGSRGCRTGVSWRAEDGAFRKAEASLGVVPGARSTDLGIDGLITPRYAMAWIFAPETRPIAAFDRCATLAGPAWLLLTAPSCAFALAISSSKDLIGKTSGTATLNTISESSYTGLIYAVLTARSLNLGARFISTTRRSQQYLDSHARSPWNRADFRGATETLASYLAEECRKLSETKRHDVLPGIRLAPEYRPQRSKAEPIEGTELHTYWRPV